MGNLSTLNEAAELAAGITSSLGALTSTQAPPPAVAPTITPQQEKSNRWDKDKVGCVVMH